MIGDLIFEPGFVQLNDERQHGGLVWIYSVSTVAATAVLIALIIATACIIAYIISKKRQREKAKGESSSDGKFEIFFSAVNFRLYCSRLTAIVMDFDVYSKMLTAFKSSLSVAFLS